MAGTLIVYKNTNFNGESHTFSSSDPNIPELKPLKLNDCISSLTVSGSGTWFLYQNVNYGGAKWSVTAQGGINGTGAYANPGMWDGKNDSISSIQYVANVG